MEPTPSTVAAAWLVLALTGAWRAERNWIDRSGRVLGTLWIVGPPTINLVGLL